MDIDLEQYLDFVYGNAAHYRVSAWNLAGRLEFASALFQKILEVNPDAYFDNDDGSISITWSRELTPEEIEKREQERREKELSEMYALTVKERALYEHLKDKYGY